jgi:hypothetical protein
VPDIVHARANINKLFREIGTDAQPDTVIDAGSKNTAPLAVEFAIAEQGRSYWNKRYEEAKKRAKEAGILGTEEDYSEGDTVVTWSSPAFDITAKKARGGEQVTVGAMKSALAKHVPQAKANAVIADCVTEKKGAVTISVAMK